MELFETHSHYDDNRFNEDRDQVIQSAYKEGIKTIINVGCSIETTKKSIELANKYEFVYAICGIHPSEIPNNNEELLKTIEILKNMVLSNNKVVGIGEIGLDYNWNKENKKEQINAFIEQIKLANELNLPVAIHTRDAIDDTIDVIKNKIEIKCGGILHCCPFNKELVKHGLEANLHIAFGGTCTFKNSKNADEIIKMVPENRILIETDSPYLAPEPVRGKRNDSRNLKYIIKKISDVKQIDVEEMAKITCENARKLFKIQ